MLVIPNSTGKGAKPPEKNSRHETRWVPVRAVDLRCTGREPGACERCGRRDLRFLHTVEHPDKGKLDVGAECAKRLCFGYAPERAERRLRNLWSRRSRWLIGNWRISRNGNETLRFLHMGETIRVTVFEHRFGGFTYCLAVAGDQPCFSRQTFATADAAKLAAFDWLTEEGRWNDAS